MPLYVDVTSGRLVELDASSGLPAPNLKVIDGETRTACGVRDGQTVTTTQMAALLDGSIGAYLSGLTDEERSALDDARSSPNQHRVISLSGVGYLGSHPGCGDLVEGLTLAFTEKGLQTRLEGSAFVDVPWHRIVSVTADSRESIEKRITATRVLLLGALGLFIKKERVVSYLVVVDTNGEWIFAIPKMPSVELHAWSQPARARIGALASSESPPPPPVPLADVDGADAIAARLERLASLHDRGLITTDEFAARRKAIVDDL